MRFFHYIFYILIFCCVSLTVNAQKTLAYTNGEELKFKVKYGWFKTSEATLKVQKSTLNKRDVHHITGFGNTVGMLDIFFKVRDSFQSYIDVHSGLPIKFVRNTSEGGYTKNKMIEFDHKKDSATVHDYKRSSLSKHAIKNESQDMLSSLYALRNQVDINNLEINQSFFLNLFFDEENFGFKATYLGEEVLKTDFGKVKTLKFRPYVQADRVFKEEESVTIWISNDKNKIPIQIKADLVVGSLTATLQEYRGLAHPFSAIKY